MPKYISMRELDAKAQELGTIGEALQWAKANGYEVDTQNGFAALPGEELPSVADQQPLFNEPTGALSRTATQAEAVVPGTDGEVVEQAQEAPAGALSEMDAIRQKILGYPAEREKARADMFERGQQYLSRMYPGPSRSQQLFALSKALLSPTPYRGFAGVMSNVNDALGAVSKARDEAMRKRSEAEMELQQSLSGAAEKDTLEALKLRYQLLKEENDAAQAAAKAGQPKYQWDSVTGRWVVQPGSGGLPPMNPKGQYVVSTPEQAASVPRGQPFVYTGDNTGKIYYGQ